MSRCILSARSLVLFAASFVSKCVCVFCPCVVFVFVPLSLSLLLVSCWVSLSVRLQCQLAISDCQRGREKPPLLRWPIGQAQEGGHHWEHHTTHESNDKRRGGQRHTEDTQHRAIIDSGCDFFPSGWLIIVHQCSPIMSRDFPMPPSSSASSSYPSFDIAFSSSSSFSSRPFPSAGVSVGGAALHFNGAAAAAAALSAAQRTATHPTAAQYAQRPNPVRNNTHTQGSIQANNRSKERVLSGLLSHCCLPMSPSPLSLCFFCCRFSDLLAHPQLRLPHSLIDSTCATDCARRLPTCGWRVDSSVGIHQSAQ